MRVGESVRICANLCESVRIWANLTPRRELASREAARVWVAALQPGERRVRASAALRKPWWAALEAGMKAGARRGGVSQDKRQATCCGVGGGPLLLFVVFSLFV